MSNGPVFCAGLGRPG